MPPVIRKAVHVRVGKRKVNDKPPAASDGGSRLACPTPKTRRREAQAANFINNLDLMQWAKSTFISSNRFLELFKVLHLERCCSNLTTGTRQPAPRRPEYR